MCAWGYVVICARLDMCLHALLVLCSTSSPSAEMLPAAGCMGGLRIFSWLQGLNCSWPPHLQPVAGSPSLRLLGSFGLNWWPHFLWEILISSTRNHIPVYLNHHRSLGLLGLPPSLPPTLILILPNFGLILHSFHAPETFLLCLLLTVHSQPLFLFLHLSLLRSCLSFWCPKDTPLLQVPEVGALLFSHISHTSWDRDRDDVFPVS